MLISNKTIFYFCFIILSNYAIAANDSVKVIDGILYLKKCLAGSLLNCSNVLDLFSPNDEKFKKVVVDTLRSTEGGYFSHYITEQGDTFMIETVDFGETARWNSFRIKDKNIKITFYLATIDEYEEPIYWNNNGKSKRFTLLLFMMITSNKGMMIKKTGDVFSEIKILDRTEFDKRIGELGNIE